MEYILIKAGMILLIGVACVGISRWLDAREMKNDQPDDETR